MPTPSLLVNLTRNATVLSPDRGRVVTFDREGRWMYYFRHGETFKRSLGSEVHLRFRRRTRQRRQLDQTEARSVCVEVWELAREVAKHSSGETRERLHTEVLPWTQPS